MMSLSTHRPRVLTGGHMGGGCDSVKAIKGKFSAERYGGQMECETAIDKVIEPDDFMAMRERGHILRGAYLDAFARLERAIMDQLIALELNVTLNAPLSHKLAKLKSAKECFSHPDKFDAQVEAIGRLNEGRTDIVHAVLNVLVRYDGNKPVDYRFGFQNACDDTKPLKIVTVDDLKTMAREAMQLANWLKKLKAITPAAPASASA